MSDVLKQIEKLRKTIDILDDDIMKLLNERLDVSSKIISLKIKNNFQVLDQGREGDILKKISKYSENSESIRRFYDLIFFLSKSGRDNI